MFIKLTTVETRRTVYLNTNHIASFGASAIGGNSFIEVVNDRDATTYTVQESPDEILDLLAEKVSI